MQWGCTIDTGSQFAARSLALLPYDPPTPKRGPRFGSHERCWLCGGETDGIGWVARSVFPDTFTNVNLARVPFSDAVCQSCVAVSTGATWIAYAARRPDLNLKTVHPLSWRSYSHLITATTHHVPHRSGWRPWLLDPPKPPFVAVIAESGQKHLLFRSLVAHDREVFPVQIEEDALIVERSRFEAVLADVEVALAAGYNRDAVVTGRMPPAVALRIGAGRYREIERALAHWRLAQPALMRLAALVGLRPAKEEG